MKFKLATLSLLLAALLACPVVNGGQEFPVSSYDFTPEPGGGWPADAGRTKLTDDIVPTPEEDWGANKTVGWNLPDGTGPTVTFTLNASQLVDVVSLNHYGSYYGFISFDLYTSNDGTNFDLVGTFENKLLNTTEKAPPAVTQDFFIDAQGQYFKMEFVNNDPHPSTESWVMLSEVEFFEVDPNYLDITEQPQATTAAVGDDVELTVAADAKTTPLSYQWKKDGGNIPGATTDTLQLTAVTADDAGIYTCTISNSANPGVESAEALVNVLVPAPLTAYGHRVINSDPVLYWSFDEDDGDAIDMVSLLANRSISATTPIRFDHGDLGNAVSFEEFDNVFGALNLDTGVNTFGPFAMEFWVKTDNNDMTNRYITEIGIPGGTGNIPAAIFGYQPAELEFFGSGARSNGFTFEDPNDWSVWHHVVLVDLDTSIEAYDNGVKVADFVYESEANLQLYLEDEIGIGSVRKSHTASPTSVFLGDLDEFAIYSFDGLTLDQIQARVNAIAMHSDFDGPAYITESPMDTTAPPETTAVLRASAAGAEPITYQWKKDGEDIEGETSPTLTLENVQPGVEDGTYTCAVSNTQGGEESEPATLEVACYYDIPGDLNNDCIVDMQDFAILAAHWLEDSSVLQ